jgi:hypothetical protein
MKFLCLFAFVFVLAGCAQEQPVEPTDGPCGPRAWTVIQGPDGVICEQASF